MIIGCPTEIKTREYRVGLTPAGAHILSNRGHDVLVQRGAGLGSAIPDDEYVRAGATLIDTADELWQKSDLVVKVKEPIEPEFTRMREGQILFTYLHLAAAQPLGKVLLERGVRAIAYETIETGPGKLPLLEPMSVVAGRMAVQVGTTHLEKEHGGKGILLGGVAGTRRARVAIIGGGVVGRNAARIAMGLGANVTVLDINTQALAYLDDIYQGQIETLYSDPHAIESAVTQADLVVGAVLLAGARAPRLVSEELVSRMESGSVIVDVAVDQGGCVETARPTTHDEPTYKVHDVVHYCVANMPGAVPQTSTYALTNATIPYLKQIANDGFEAAVKADKALALGVNAADGKCTHPAVAEALGVDYTPLNV